MNSFVVAHIDYCNCLLAGAPQYQLNKLQTVMNSTERLICGLNKFDHISRVLCDRLHWLPVEQRIQYKLCLLVYKARCGLALQYLVDFCQSMSAVSGRNGLRFGYIDNLLTVDEILSKSEHDLFVKTSIPGHSPHHLLPPHHSSNLRER